MDDTINAGFFRAEFPWSMQTRTQCESLENAADLTRALACEWAQHGLTVNCISPGQIPKPGIDPTTRDRFLTQVPLGRLGLPADLNGAVALFAGPAGRWITGQNLTVDGGWSAW